MGFLLSYRVEGMVIKDTTKPSPEQLRRGSAFDHIKCHRQVWNTWGRGSQDVRKGIRIERKPLKTAKKCRKNIAVVLCLLRRSFLRQVSGFDPHADPHGETSGRKQWKQQAQRALISEQKVLKTSGKCSFYSFSTFRNQQVAGSSPATSSRSRRKSYDFRRFSLLFVRIFRCQNRLTHTVTHTAKCLKSVGEDTRIRSSPQARS